MVYHNFEIWEVKSNHPSMFFFCETYYFNFDVLLRIIEDGCLEDDIIIVENVDAEWTRCEEGESLDQSLGLEKNPASLQNISFSLSLVNFNLASPGHICP